MTYYHVTSANVQSLVDHLEGMTGNVARAWLSCEGQAVNNPTNPLNILYYGATGRGQIGQRGRFAVYRSPDHGLRDAAWVIENLSYYAGVRRVLNDPHRTDLKLAQSIEDSPWAAGHYGGGGSKNGCIVGHLKKPVPPPEPADCYAHIIGHTGVYNSKGQRVDFYEPPHKLIPISRAVRRVGKEGFFAILNSAGKPGGHYLRQGSKGFIKECD